MSDLPPEVAAALARVDDLVEKFDMHPDPTVRDRVIALLNGIDVVHRAGIRALMDLVVELGAGERAIADPCVRMLVDLYELDKTEARITAVLDSVREHIQDHGGQLEVVETGSEVVHIKVASLGHSCDGTALREVAERELREQLADLSRIVVDDADPPVAPGNFVPLTSLRLRRRSTLAWHNALAASELPPGTMRGVLLDELAVLVANVKGEYVAYHDRCPGSSLPLHGGTLEGDILACPWHHCQFDIRDGRRLDERRAGGNLERIAVRAEQGRLEIGLPVEEFA